MVVVATAIGVGYWVQQADVFALWTTTGDSAGHYGDLHQHEAIYEAGAH
jgi:hypothetical protein